MLHQSCTMLDLLGLLLRMCTLMGCTVFRHRTIFLWGIAWIHTPHPNLELTQGSQKWCCTAHTHSPRNSFWLNLKMVRSQLDLAGSTITTLNIIHKNQVWKVLHSPLVASVLCFWKTNCSFMRTQRLGRGGSVVSTCSHLLYKFRSARSKKNFPEWQDNFLRSLLFWAHLSHVDSHTDNFSCLHPHRTGGLPVPAGRGVESRHRCVFYALSPWACLPMIHSARVLITAAGFL